MRTTAMMEVREERGREGVLRWGGGWGEAGGGGGGWKEGGRREFAYVNCTIYVVDFGEY